MLTRDPGLEASQVLNLVSKPRELGLSGQVLRLTLNFKHSSSLIYA